MMNYARFISPLAWILTFFVALFIYNRFFGPLPFSVTSVSTQKSDTFNVSGEGKVSVPPDIVLINAGVQVQAATVKAAQDQLNSNINQVSQALKQLGIDEKDIQTSNYSIYPTYDYTSGSQRITGYSANSNLFIKVREMDKANSVIDAATANGANQVSGIVFEVDDKTKAENEARELAVSQAKKKAENAAKIAGFQLGRIVNYSESFGDFPGPIALRAQGSVASEAPATSIEPGSNEITVTVTLSYELR